MQGKCPQFAGLAVPNPGTRSGSYRDSRNVHHALGLRPMREPRADRTYATPDDVPASYLLPELIEGAKQGRIVYLSEHDEPVAAVVPLTLPRPALPHLGA